MLGGRRRIRCERSPGGISGGGGVAEYAYTARGALAASLGAEAIVAPVNDMPGVESLVTTEAREPSTGLVVIPDAFTVLRQLLATMSLPSIGLAPLLKSVA